MALEVGGPGTQRPASGVPVSGATALPAGGRGRGKSSFAREPEPAPSVRSRHRRRQVVRRVDLWSVLKISLCFYLCGLAVTMVAGIVLWLIASGLGLVENVEQFMGDLLSAKDFRFLSVQILEGGVLVGLVLVALLVIITVIAAAFYNLFAELIGGVEIVVEDE